MKRIRPGIPMLAASVIVMLISSVAHAKETDGSALEAAVLAGKDVRVVLNLSECTEHSTNTPGPAVRGSLHPDAIIVSRDHTINFSSTHFTVRADGKAVTEFNKYRVHRDGNAEFQAMVLDPVNFSTLQSKQFDCAAGKGMNFVF